MRKLQAVPVLLAPLIFLACSDATGSLVGGDPIDTGAPTTTTPSGDGGGPTTNVTSADCMPDGGHAGSTWTDLYACYFGPNAPDSCAGTGTNCHATSASAGGSFSWVCGATQASCYTGMTSYAPLDPRAGMANPTMNHLYTVLCGSPSGSGLMPLGCLSGTVMLSDDFTRIEQWIAAGAPNN
jgi:hypothetical protein